ncbi:MAG TPA: hypothetical protein PK560_06730 [bacterium]|jgi:hypothetical protein|nr:hypothetical protein [bacterium]MDX9805098.1 hypothetical protein [bacterium]HOG43760.1 hypothetical protein [bacterium]
MNMDIFESIKNDTGLLESVRYVFENTEINNNSLKNLIKYLREISARENKQYSEILSIIKADEILKNPEMTGKTRSEEILRKLYHLRFPLWSSKQQEFKSIANRFRALTGGEIIFPEFAEGNSFKISFEIRKQEDVDKIFQTISIGKDILSESLKKIKE